jgi:hypothetical protein
VSRTKKGNKGAGFEYWGRRPTKYPFADPGKAVKKNTHKLERKEGKREAKDDQADR